MAAKILMMPSMRVEPLSTEHHRAAAAAAASARVTTTAASAAWLVVLARSTRHVLSSGVEVRGAQCCAGLLWIAIGLAEVRGGTANALVVSE